MYGESHKWYDFTSLISVEENGYYCDYLQQQVTKGNWDKDPTHHPKYQIGTRLFDDSALVNLKMSFLYSCFDFLHGPVQMVDLKSWGLITNSEIFKTVNGGWHHHDQYQEYGCVSVLSGIYYANVNSQEEGTKFEDFVAEPRLRNWLIYPGTLKHATNKVTGMDWRILYVADLLYK